MLQSGAPLLQTFVAVKGMTSGEEKSGYGGLMPRTIYSRGNREEETLYKWRGPSYVVMSPQPSYAMTFQQEPPRMLRKASELIARRNSKPPCPVNPPDTEV